MSRPEEDFELRELEKDSPRPSRSVKADADKDKPKRLTPAQKKLLQKKGRLIGPFLLVLTLIISAAIAFWGSK